MTGGEVTGSQGGRLADLAASTELGFVIAPDGTIGDASVAARILLGLRDDTSHRLDELADEPADEVAAFLEACRTAREPQVAILRLHGTRASGRRWACAGTPMGNGEVLLICRPQGQEPGIAERIQARLVALTVEVEQRALIEAQARIEAAAKSRFLASASHDLRQPLHAMTLFTRALSRRVEGKEAVELVDQLGVALGSLQRMFDSLLDISKLDGGLVEPRLGDVDLVELFDQLGTELVARAEAAGLEGRVHPLAATVYTDRALLERIVRNLINNALKFTAKGGVLLAARRRSDRIAVEVIDTGMGMSDEQTGEMFNEFSRGRHAARGANDGLGLGLSIVRRLTGLLGIELEIASREGRGTRFRLLLPVGHRSFDALRRARDDSAVFAKPDLKGRTIIVLDDDPLAVASLSRELADHGVTVVPAGNAEELARMGPGDAADAAIVDYDLGRELGPEVIETFLRTTGRHFPLLIVTGSTEPAVLQRLQALGHPWITKPVDPDVLLALVSGMLPRD